MSIKIMSLIFEGDLPPTKRLIMLSLADHANDEGVCYPSISRLCQRTGLKQRSVQKNIAELEADGYIKRDMNGGRRGSNLYTLTPAPDAPRTKCAPAPDALPPRTRCTPTPAPDAPKPSRNHQEPSLSKDAREVLDSLTQWASPEAAKSFIAYRRKQKGKALTVTAARRLANQLEQIAQRGGDTDDALGMAEERGWQSVQSIWYFNAKERSDGKSTKTGSEVARSAADRFAARRMDSGEGSSSSVPLLSAEHAGGQSRGGDR